MKRELLSVRIALMLALSGLLVGQGLGLPVAIAGESEGGTTPGPLARSSSAAAVLDDVEAALAADLALVAESQGWSPEQAQAYLANQEAIEEIAVKIATERPDIFVGSALPSAPDQPPVLLIKGPAPALVWDIVASSAVAVEVRENQPYSFSELDARSGLTNRLLREQGYRDVSTSFDLFAEGVIDVEVVAQNGLPREPSRIIALLPANLRDGVRVTAVAAPALPDSAFGGMRTRDDGNDLCTSGFTVERLNHTERMIGSAGHCGVVFINEIVHPGQGVHLIEGGAQTIGQWGDFEYLFVPGQLKPDDFYSDPNVIRDVNAVKLRAGIAQNEAVCGYGRSSNERVCMLVANVSVDCGAAPQKQVRMNADHHIPGDSGGPWFFGLTAYGFHRGGCGGNGNDHWSVADLIDEALIVYVPTV